MRVYVFFGLMDDFVGVRRGRGLLAAVRSDEGVGDVSGCDGATAEEATVEALHAFLGRLDRVKSNVDLAGLQESAFRSARRVLRHEQNRRSGLTVDSFSTAMATTGPYCASHSPLTSSRSSRSQPRSVSSSGLNMFFKSTERVCATGILGRYLDGEEPPGQLAV